LFANERIDRIIKLLNDNGKVVVKELSLLFEVTEDCIRKDLKTLEQDGLIKRTYGGAILNRKTAPKSNVFNRRNDNLITKSKIAQKAFDLIEAGETIFLDISTTNILVADKIASGNKALTVITNMLDVVSALSKCAHVKVICIGGVFSRELDGFIGSTAIDSISKYNVNKSFIGSCGVDIFDKSVTTFDVEDGNTKKAIIKAGKKVFMVMSRDKFDVDGTYKFAELYDIDAIIVDELPESKICEYLKEIKIQLI